MRVGVLHFHSLLKCAPQSGPNAVYGQPGSCDYPAEWSAVCQALLPKLLDLYISFLLGTWAAAPNGKYCPDIMQIFAPTNDETCRAQSARYVGDIKAQ